MPLLTHLALHVVGVIAPREADGNHFCFRVKAEARPPESSEFFRSEAAGSNSHPPLAVAGDWCPLGARQIIGIEP
jgi:hypothetical protein